ncbi:hypothetical protein BGY98DRAFT_267892 [Russula aff. rugulosa BPL654]|nr:hypothetical protein BGY98DRAFT_267892 [Russula aff. rugulosa BPL654]
MRLVLEGVGGNNSALPVREAQSPVVPQIETLDETPFSACGCIPSGVFRPFISMRGGSNIDHSQRNVSDQSIQTGQGSGQADAQIPMPSNPTFDPGPCNTTSDSESEEPRMIRDFDGSARKFLKLFIFAGLFSAALTAFVVDNLKPSPADEIVYYLRQISVQQSSIAPQVAIPPTPPPPFPQFSTLASDVRVNFFSFMALTFSLLEALLAILVQQWVRKYMAVFEWPRRPIPFHILKPSSAPVSDAL